MRIATVLIAAIPHSPQSATDNSCHEMDRFGSLKKCLRILFIMQGRKIFFFEEYVKLLCKYCCFEKNIIIALC